METRTIRLLIYVFSGLIAVFLLLIGADYLASRFEASKNVEDTSGHGPGKPQSAAEMARRAIAEAKAQGGLPAPRTNFSSAPFSSGGVMVVRNKEFNGVAEKPKSVMDMLNELGGGDKRLPSPIKLKDADLDKKIAVGGKVERTRVKATVTPETGRGDGQEGTTLLGAPVDYKVFKSSETWWAFANARKQKAVRNDFSKNDLLILVSVSDFPNGIFSVQGVEAGPKETVVRYRVDPMGMSPDTPAAQREAFAYAPVPKGRPVRLEQVP